MKKFMSTMLVAVCLGLFAAAPLRAEGDIPIGGRSCPQGTTCLAGQTAETPKEETTIEITVFKVWRFLKAIF